VGCQRPPSVNLTKYEDEGQGTGACLNSPDA
jgi:hypothetical protein